MTSGIVSRVVYCHTPGLLWLAKCTHCTQRHFHLIHILQLISSPESTCATPHDIVFDLCTKLRPITPTANSLFWVCFAVRQKAPSNLSEATFLEKKNKNTLKELPDLKAGDWKLNLHTCAHHARTLQAQRSSCWESGLNTMSRVSAFQPCSPSSLHWPQIGT